MLWLSSACACFPEGLHPAVAESNVAMACHNAKLSIEAGVKVAPYVPCHAAQIKSGARYAKGPTGAEFKDIMKSFMHEANQVMERACNYNQEMIQDNLPIYSFDNWAGHNDAPDLGITEHIESRVPLTPRSPDMHKVIEHPFNTLGSKFGKELWLHRHENDVQIFMSVVEDIMFSMPASSFQRDIKSLHDTYRNILANNGGWASKGLN